MRRRGCRKICLCFNPRAREGRDLTGLFDVKTNFAVSIHAPARGATFYLSFVLLPQVLFQSTRPRGARHGCCRFRGFLPCFNPRAREGRDARAGTLLAGIAAVSIHAPARGATTGFVPATDAEFQFQSTRPRGARQGIPAISRPPRCFNPRAREGRDIIRSGI